MAQAINKLTTRQVDTIAKPGRHADGGGLYLVVGPDGGSRKWVLRYMLNGKRRDMGLGSAGRGGLPLAQARAAASEARGLIQKGIDPLEHRRADAAAASPPAAIPTFGEMADALLASLGNEWRNDKHRAQWEMTLRVYAKPLRPLPVDEVDTNAVLAVIKPIWSTKNETASRLRGRIERVLDYAKTLGHRSGENPALWRGHLSNVLPKRQKLTRGHHPAMPYDQVPAFVQALRLRDSVGARALEFTILTAARSGEVLGATWGEIELDKALWTIPAARMKGARQHRVPLPGRAVEILREVAALRRTNKPGEPLFPGSRPGRGLSNMAMDMLLRRMGRDDATVHGFRSSFRDWAGERTSFPREVAEAALAHLVGDDVERAYRRGDALEKRRSLMQEWADYQKKSPADAQRL